MIHLVQERASWAITGVIAITIIVIGFEGSLGKVLGCIFTPGLMALN